MKNTIIFLIALILLSGTVYAGSDQTQQYSKIYLAPYYKQSMAANTYSNFSVTIAPPDGITKVFSAIITFEAYISPTLNMGLWVNGQQCTPPSFQISTTYMTSGKASMSYDCSNIITGTGTYNIAIRPDKNTGAVYGYLDLAYSNKPLATMTLHGTDYLPGSDAKAWLQLLNNSNQEVDNGLCYLIVTYPNSTIFIDRALMLSGSHGIYYYDFTAPNVTGVYPQVAECIYIAEQNPFFAVGRTITQGTETLNTYTATWADDGVYHRIQENTTAGARYVVVEYNISAFGCTNISESRTNGGTIGWSGLWDNTPAGDAVQISVWNYSSSAWVVLPNSIQGLVTEQTITNSLVFNNATTMGLVDSGGYARVRLSDTIPPGTDGTSTNLNTDYLYFSCEQTTGGDWQRIEGSSEMNIFDLAYSVWNYDGLINFNVLSQMASAVWDDVYAASRTIHELFESG